MYYTLIDSGRNSLWFDFKEVKGQAFRKCRGVDVPFTLSLCSQEIHVGYYHCCMSYPWCSIKPIIILYSSRKCPEGFFVKRLEEHHAEFIAPFWPYGDDISAKQAFFKNLIKNFHSVGVFTNEEPTIPIAWCVQYQYGQPGNLYVIDKYRRKGFASLLLEHMCNCIREDGLEPQLCVDDVNDCGKKLMDMLGLVQQGQFRYLKSST